MMEANGLPVGTLGAAMCVRRIVASVAAAAMIAGGVSVAVAPAASAADQSLIVFCGATGYRVFPVTDITAAPGDTVYVTPDAGTCTERMAWASWEDAESAKYFSTPPYQEGAPFVYTILPDAPLGTMPYAAGDLPYLCNDCDVGTMLRFTIAAPSADTTPAASTPIPAWVQAYGIFHHDDACQTGWGNSWQKWAEPVTGGWVCTRTIPSLG
jgi:hypothetical protein